MLKNFFKICLVLLVVTFAIQFSDAAAVNYSEKTKNITIYGNSSQSWGNSFYRYNRNNGGYAIITKSIDSELNQGTNDLYIRNLPKQVEPSSFKLTKLGDKTKIIEQQVALKGSATEQLLEQNLGKVISVNVAEGSKTNSYKGVLLETKPHLVLQEEGKVRVIKNYSNLVFKNESSKFDKNYMKWVLYSNEGDPLNAQYSYKTGGINWSASYDIYLQDENDINDIKSRLVGWANIVNSTKIKISDSGLKLVAGDVNQSEPPMVYARKSMAMADGMAAAESAPAGNFTQEKFSDQYIYKIARAVDIDPNSYKKIKLFDDKQNISIAKKYVYDSIKNPNKVGVVLHIENKQQNGLGFALPGGKYTVYAKDSKADFEITGEDKTGHKKDKDVIKLNIASAFDITAKRSQIKSTYDNKRRYGKYTIEIELENAKDQDISLTVKEDLNNRNWKILDNSKPYIEVGKNKIEFPIKLKAKSKEKISYTVEYKW